MATQRITPDSVPMQFSMFYTRGYLAVAFRQPEDAARVHQTLIAGGFHAEDAQLVSSESVVKGASRSLAAVNPIVRMLGYEYDALTAHVELAEKGYTFMLIYAPSNLDTDRVMSVVRRYEYGLAHKFERFAVHEL